MTTNGTDKMENPLQKMTAEGAARMEQMMEEMKKFEAQQHQRAMELIDESAKVMKASFDYGIKMTEEWRKMAVEANKQAVEMMTSTKWT